MSKEGECIFTFRDKGPEKGGNHCMRAFDHLGNSYTSLAKKIIKMENLKHCMVCL